MSYAIVFPGQGSQSVGMGREFFDAYDVSRDAFAEADDALGFKLSDTIFSGTEEELKQTATTQPAILTTSIAIYRALKQELGDAFSPACFAGHSLGEYTALAASGVLSLADAVRLVRKRGELMQSAVPSGKGAMAAIMGVDRATIDAICSEAAQGEVVIAANINSPVQIVISGDAPAVARASAIAKERASAKVVPLNVSAPFHCSLMKETADKLLTEFERYTWHDASAPIVSNVDAKLRTSAADIKRALFEQTYSPVQWVDEIAAMQSNGVGAFIEMGPGSVLIGLIKRIAKGVPTASLNKTSDIAKIAELTGGAAK